MATYSIFDGIDGPGEELGAGFDTPVCLGIEFAVNDSDCYVTELKYWRPAITYDSEARVFGLYEVVSNTVGILLDSVTQAVGGTGWQTATLDEPILLDQLKNYRSVTFHPAGHYAATGAYFPDSSMHLAEGPLFYKGPGLYKYNGSLIYPDDSFNDTNYWADVTVYQADPPPEGPVVKRYTGTEWVDTTSVQRLESGIWVPATVTKLS